jgi:O-antigen/teichoic acid export membrane protein
MSGLVGDRTSRRERHLGVTAALLAAWLAPILATVIATPFVLRHIGAIEYGLFSVVLGLVVSIAAMGMSRPLAISTAAGGDADVRRSATWGIALAVAGALVVAVLAAVMPLTWLIGDQVDLNHARLAILAGSFAVLGTALMSTASGRVIGVSRFVAVGSIAATLGVATSVGYVTVASLGGLAIALVLWNGVVACVGGLLFVLAGRRRHHEEAPVGSSEPATGPETLSLWPFVVVQLAGNLAIVIERVGLAATTGLEAVTVFVVPHTMVLTLHAGLVWLTAPLLTHVVHLVRADDQVGLGRVYRRASRVGLAAAVFGGATLVVLGHDLLDRWLGGLSVMGRGPFLILTIYAFALPLTVVAWTVAEATGNARENAYVGLIWLTVVVLGAVMSEWFGVRATVVARAAVVLTLPLYIRRVERRALGGVQSWSMAWLARLLAGAGLAAACELILWKVLDGNLLAAVVALGGGTAVFVTLMPPDLRLTLRDATGSDLS